MIKCSTIYCGNERRLRCADNSRRYLRTSQPAARRPPQYTAWHRGILLGIAVGATFPSYPTLLLLLSCYAHVTCGWQHSCEVRTLWNLNETKNILDCDQSNVLLAHHFQFSAKFFKFCRRIWLTSFNNSALKTFARRKYLGYMYIWYKPSYSQFWLKIRCHGNKGRSEVNLNDPVELAVPENHTLEPKITNLFCIQPKLWPFLGRSVGRSSLFIKLMSYTPLRYVRNVARED